MTLPTIFPGTCCSLYCRGNHLARESIYIDKQQCSQKTELVNKPRHQHVRYLCNIHIFTRYTQTSIHIFEIKTMVHLTCSTCLNGGNKKICRQMTGLNRSVRVIRQDVETRRYLFQLCIVHIVILVKMLDDKSTPKQDIYNI